MAYARITFNHEFEISFKLEPINPKYETRQYVSGGFFLGCGSINTEYKDVLISHDGLKKIEICAKCGFGREDKIHDLIIRADRFN